MDSLIQDVRYALRALLKSRGFTAIALLTIAVGTGANATVFSFLNALLLRPAPGVTDAASVVAIYTSDYSSTPFGESSYPDYLSLQAETTAFERMAAFSDDRVAVVRVGETVDRIRVAEVTGEYFDLLGLRPAVGRLLADRDTNAPAESAAVIRHDLWRRLFGADTAVAGTTIVVNNRAFTIVGVAPRGFEGLDLGRAVDVWTPLPAPGAHPRERQNRRLSVVGRLRAGVSLAGAQAEVGAIAGRLGRLYPESNLGTLQAPDQPRPMYARRHSRIHPAFRGEVVMIGSVIMAAVGVVLLIACANVANLLLARATARGKEMAIRLALGAGRRRLVRQLLTESLLLGLVGGALGLLFALWTADVLPSFFPADQARMLDTSIDGRVLSFTVVVAFLSSVLFGLAPAMQAVRSPAVAVLRGDTARISDGRRGTTLRRVLVIAQVALAVVLLVASSLLAQSLANSMRVDLGFGLRDAVLASVEVPPADFTPERGAAYYADALERIRALPGIEDATFVRTLPLGIGPRRGFRTEGYEPQPGEDRELHYNVVGDRYFETMRIPIVAGRAFDSRDGADTARVVMVNETFARRYFNGNAVGRRITDSSNTVLEIVGVVPAHKYRSVQEPPVPFVYYPLAQSYAARMTLVARTAGDPAAAAGAVRRVLRDTNDGVAVFRTTTLFAHVAEALTGDRLTATLVGVSGAMALLLASVGVYGVIAYGVVRRMREIGVRVALGARRADIVRLVVGEGLSVTAAGIVLGLAAAAAATRLLATMLFGVSPSDATTYFTVAAVLTVGAALAAWAPARRALRADPMTVLRQE